NVKTDDWEDPLLLDCFPVHQIEPLPGIVGDFSAAVSRATETPLELAQGLALATIATAVHGKITVLVKPGYSEPTNIWINVALESGNRKSSVHQSVTAPLLSWESNQRQRLKPKIRELESQRRNQESRIKSLRARYGKAKRDDLAGIQREIMDLERDLVQVPVFPKVWAQDVTPEHLGTLMGEHGGKMAILSAEGGIFDLMAGRYSNGIPNLDLFLQGHSGDPVRVDRGSRDSVYIERPALTMGISPQPEVLRRIASAPGFRGRGLLARYLYLLPESTLGHRKMETEPVPAIMRKQWEETVYSLLNIEPSTDEMGNFVPHIIRLSKQAYSEWLEFSRAVEVELREGGRFEFIRDWAGKLPGAAARLAGVIHCAHCQDHSWKEKIQLETMQQALALGAIFSEHALKVFNLMGCDKTIEGAQKVWRWIERGKFKTFRKRDCHNALQGCFPIIQKVQNIQKAGPGNKLTSPTAKGAKRDFDSFDSTPDRRIWEKGAPAPRAKKRPRQKIRLVTRMMVETWRVGRAWMLEHLGKLEAAGWTRHELLRAGRFLYPCGTWGLAFTGHWTKEGLKIEIEANGAIAWAWGDATGRTVRQRAARIPTAEGIRDDKR
ncbi:MAG: YfjI family protein, partial [Desulfobacterales bacterium]